MRPALRRVVPEAAAAFPQPDAVASRTSGGRVPLPVRVGGDAIADRSHVWSWSRTRLYRAADEQTEHGRHRVVAPSDEPTCWKEVDDDGGGGGGGTGSGKLCADDECVKFWRHLPLRDISLQHFGKTTSISTTVNFHVVCALHTARSSCLLFLRQNIAMFVSSPIRQNRVRILWFHVSEIVDFITAATMKSERIQSRRSDDGF